MWKVSIAPCKGLVEELTIRLQGAPLPPDEWMVSFGLRPIATQLPLRYCPIKPSAGRTIYRPSEQLDILGVRRPPVIRGTTSTPNRRFEEMIAQQGKGPVNDPRILLDDFWPEDEPIERFLDALHEWRGHKKSDRAA